LGKWNILRKNPTFFYEKSYFFFGKKSVFREKISFFFEEIVVFGRKSDFRLHNTSIFLLGSYPMKFAPEALKNNRIQVKFEKPLPEKLCGCNS
jgi:hypothetical protein